MIRPAQLERLPALSVSTERGRPSIAVTCSECGEVCVGPVTRQLQGGPLDAPPPIAAKFFHRKGWTLDRGGVRAACPKCQPRGESDMNTASTEALRAQAKMHRLLDEHFTPADAGGAYDEGWTDARIAAESGLSEVEVARVRDAVCGPLADPELAKLGAAIADQLRCLERDGGALLEMLEQIRGEVATLTGRTTAELQSLHSRVADLRTRREARR